MQQHHTGIFDGGRPHVGFLGLGSSGMINQPRFAGFGLGEIAYDDKVFQLQGQLNTALSMKGMSPIAVDGKLGPRTCGAITWLGTQSDLGHVVRVDLLGHALVDLGCTSWTMPVHATTGAVAMIPTTFRSNLPWMVESEETRQVQRDVNLQLDGHGYNTLTTDGKLGPRLCGAMRKAGDWGQDWMSSYGANCQSFEDPTPSATAEFVDPGAGEPLQPPPSVPGVEPEIAPPAGRSTRAGMVVAGLLGVAVVGGLYAFSKKRR
jgi:hypothetical protein